MERLPISAILQRAEVYARVRGPLKHNLLAYRWATLLTDCSAHGRVILGEAVPSGVVFPYNRAHENISA